MSYRTAHYKLHYYETPTNLKFVMLTDTKMNNLRIVLHQIYVGLYVEYGECAAFRCLEMRQREGRVEEWRQLEQLADESAVVKNPLSPVEHPGGVGVDCESFELGLDQFVVCIIRRGSLLFLMMLICCPEQLVAELRKA